MTCKNCISYEKCVSLGYGDTEANSAELCCKGFKKKSVYRDPISPDSKSSIDNTDTPSSSKFHRMMDSWVAALVVVPVFCAPVVEFIITQTVRFSFISAVLLFLVGLVGLLAACVSDDKNSDERAQDFGQLLILSLGTLLLGAALCYMGADIIKIFNDLFKRA